MPDWVDLVKLGKHKELAPSDENWFYIRAGKSKDYSKIPLSFLFYLHSKRVFYLGVKCLLSKRMHSFSTCCFHIITVAVALQAGFTLLKVSAQTCDF